MKYIVVRTCPVKMYSSSTGRAPIRVRRIKGFKDRCIGPIYGTATVESIVPLALEEFPHSSPEAARTTQARETSTSEGGN
jgi:hypothetical protein